MSYELDLNETKTATVVKVNVNTPKTVPFRQSLFAKFLWVFIVVPFSALSLLIYLNDSDQEMTKKYSRIQSFNSDVVSPVEALSLELTRTQTFLFRQLSTPSDKNRTDFQEVWAGIWKSISALKHLSSDLQLKQFNEKLDKDFSAIVKEMQDLSALSGEVLVFSKRERLQEMEELEKRTRTHIKDFASGVKQTQAQLIQQLQKSEQDRFWTVFALLCGTLFLLLAGFLYFSFSISKRVKNIYERCLMLSSRTPDLTLHIENHGKDELGRMTEAFDQFIDKTYNLVYTIATNTGQVMDSIGTVSEQIKSVTKEAHLLEGNASTEQVCMELCDLAVRSLNTGLNSTIASIEEIIKHTLDVQKQMNVSNEKVKTAFENVQGSLKKTIRTDFNTKELLKTVETLRFEAINLAIELYSNAQNTEKSFMTAVYFSETLQIVINIVENCFSSIKEVNESITKSSNLASEAIQGASKLSDHFTALEFDIHRIQKGVVSHIGYVAEVSKQVQTLGTTIHSNGNAIHNVAQSSEKMTKEANNLASLIHRLNQAVTLFQLYKDQEILPTQGDSDDKQNVA